MKYNKRASYFASGDSRQTNRSTVWYKNSTGEMLCGMSWSNQSQPLNSVCCGRWIDVGRKAAIDARMYSVPYSNHLPVQRAWTSSFDRPLDYWHRLCLASFVKSIQNEAMSWRLQRNYGRLSDRRLRLLTTSLELILLNSGLLCETIQLDFDLTADGGIERTVILVFAQLSPQWHFDK